MDGKSKVFRGLHYFYCDLDQRNKKEEGLEALKHLDSVLLKKNRWEGKKEKKQ